MTISRTSLSARNIRTCVLPILFICKGSLQCKVNSCSVFQTLYGYMVSTWTADSFKKKGKKTHLTTHNKKIQVEEELDFPEITLNK